MEQQANTTTETTQADGDALRPINQPHDALGNPLPVTQQPPAAPEVITKWEQLGIESGKKIQGAQDAADILVGKCAREVLVSAFHQMKGVEALCREFLHGYRKSFPGKSQAARASEAKRIFDALRLDPDRIAAGPESYFGLVTLSRKVIADATGKAESRGGGQRGARVTDKGVESMQERIKVMTPVQAATVTNAAITQMQAGLAKAKPGAWEVAVIAVLESCANRLKTSDVPMYQNLGATVIDVVQDYQANIAAEKKNAETGAAATLQGVQNVMDTPSPAQAEPAQAETAPMQPVTAEQAVADVQAAIDNDAAQVAEAA